jgi:hypothetical protein
MAAHSIPSSFAHSSRAIANRPSLKSYAPARVTTPSLKLRDVVTRAVNAITDRHNSERFYQDHVAAIFAGIYTGGAAGVALGTLGIYLYAITKTPPPCYLSDMEGGGAPVSQ